MGRLFWKIFLFIWLGQMAAVVGTGVLFWLEREGRGDNLQERRPFPELNRPRPSMLEALSLPPQPPISGADRPPQPGHKPPRGLHIPLIPLVTGLVAGVLCAAGLAWYFAKPIRQLRQSFALAADGHLDVRAGPGMGARRDELADLGADFDSMVERLQQLLDGQRQLLHDVSHEMRSPLARLQAAVGLARQQPERLENSLSRVERECERMNQLIGELLTLSRLETGVDGNAVPIDIAELMDELVADARFEGKTRQVEVDFRPGTMGFPLGNAELLHRAIENVVRNALRHSPAGSRIQIEAARVGDDGLVVTVADQGPGVPESELASIFQPFFRSEGSVGDGYGLGLAIARRVLEHMNGRIEAENRQNGGLIVRLIIPLE